MAKILLILTILLTITAAIFGFQTKDKIAALQATVTQSNKEATNAKNNLVKAKDDLKSAQDLQKTAEDKAATKEAEASSAKAVLDKAKSDLDAATAQIAAKQAEVDQAKKDLADANAKAGNGAVAPEATAELEKKLKDAQTQLTESQTLLQTQQTKIKDAEDRADTLTKEKARRDAQVMAKGLEGQVMAVNQGWNFVVISIGDRQGAVANAQLIVKRGDSMVGKVRISSVEPATSIADILPESVVKGQHIMPGDRVIFAGQ